jgi:hypothetical protein
VHLCLPTPLPADIFACQQLCLPTSVPVLPADTDADGQFEQFLLLKAMLATHVVHADTFACQYLYGYTTKFLPTVCLHANTFCMPAITAIPKIC